MSDIQLLKSSRGSYRKKITESHNRIASFVNLSEAEKLSKLKLIQSFETKLESLNQDIQSLLWDDAHDVKVIEKDIDECISYTVKIEELKVHLATTRVRTNSGNARSLLKSPTAPLPKYTSAPGEDITRFFAQFDAAVGKFPYSDYEKLQLLKQQVSGRATKLLESLQADKQGYSDAKKLLDAALASTELQKFETLKRMADMRLSYDDDPFDYISQIKSIDANFNKLSITVEDVKRYFYWTGLNESFKNQLINLTGETRPSLQEINDNFFKASERYVLAQEKFKKRRDSKQKNNTEKVKSQSNAVDAKFKQKSNTKPFFPCTLCSEIEKKTADHPIYQCKMFSNNEARVKELKRMKGCIKCANVSHAEDSCAFRFKSKCKHCQNDHFSFLCVKDKVESTANNAAAEVEVNSATVGYSCSAEWSSSNKILPTFTFEIHGNQVRALKDGGSQENLISASLANRLKLKILNPIKVRLNGINGLTLYNTRKVEVPMNIDGKLTNIQATVMPEIKVKLQLNDLNKIVQTFTQQGYKLCDKKLYHLSNKIEDLDFILGSDSAFCLPETDILFGKERKSIYSTTPFGILLKGNISQMLTDIQQLEPFSERTINNSFSVNATELAGCKPDETENLEHSIQPLKKSPNVNIADVLNSDGTLNEQKLLLATDQMLNDACNVYTNYDTTKHENHSELNSKLTQFALENTTRDEEGRLTMPLLWNHKVSHLLGKNFNLSKQILFSNLRRYKTKPECLQLIDNVIREQTQMGIIEQIPDLNSFLDEHPECSFLPHMGVFKMNRETTKCRVVYLSNLHENDSNKPMTVSHNQCINAGPSLNQKLSASLIHLRFDSYLLGFDIVKAFNNIALSEIDSNRLCLLWFKNVSKQDYSLVAYKNVRLSFGLRCSPTILLLALYKMLILDTEGDCPERINLKKQIYQNSYMDNCAASCNNPSELANTYKQLNGIFNPYQFYLQQFITNDSTLQNEIDKSLSQTTPEIVKLLGMKWDRKNDQLFTEKIELNANACSKRQILSTIASQFDLFNFNGPIMNRSRVFMHGLQCNRDYDWDDKLGSDLLKEWNNIVRQANSAPQIKLNRFVGERGDHYKLIAFSDSSKKLFGCVVYLQNIKTKEVHFILAKNRMVKKEMDAESIPTLEVCGVSLASVTLIDVYKDLTGPDCVQPIQIDELCVFTDSTCCLNWLNSYSNKLSKMQKRSVKVMNQIAKIDRLCEIKPITFSFVPGSQNPADLITRCVSYNTLIKTNYFTGPAFLQEDSSNQDLNEISVTIPNPLAQTSFTGFTSIENGPSDVFNYTKTLTKVSRLETLIGIYQRMFRALEVLSSKFRSRKLKVFGPTLPKNDDPNYYHESLKLVIQLEQKSQFPELYDYFQNNTAVNLRDIPKLMKRLNIFPDEDGILRVKHKLMKFKDDVRYTFPILLAKDSVFTQLLVRHYHEKFNHVGKYPLLNEIRKNYWLCNPFTVVKKALKACLKCHRINARPISLNQNDYRKERIDPPKIPYATSYMDYWGPVTVKINGERSKVWVFIITCMWSRSVNLKLCTDLSTKEFLRSFQLHCFEHGVPQLCISDLGSQLVSGGNIIADFLKDNEILDFLNKRNIKPISFDNYFKGCSKLGGLVESCVKSTKRLMYGAIGKNILDIRDFEFFLEQTIHIVNRRPIGFKDALRDDSGDCLPETITPEMLVRGYDLVSYNVNPGLQNFDTFDPDWNNEPHNVVKDEYFKLRKVKDKLIQLYQQEFLQTLFYQATDKPERYKPLKHDQVSVGDIVLLKEQFTKAFDYPLARIKKIIVNDLGEVTNVVAMKGKNKELVKRHSSTVIPLLKLDQDDAESIHIDSTEK